MKINFRSIAQLIEYVEKEARRSIITKSKKYSAHIFTNMKEKENMTLKMNSELL